MNSKTDLMLKSLIGSDGLETLEKHVYRKDSESPLGPLDIYLPLLVVPRTILSWLSQTLKGMQVGEVKEVEFPGDSTIMINFQKQGRDAYRAEFIQGGRVIHQFEKMNLPAIGGHLMTVGEMYDSFVDTPKAIMDLGGVTEELAAKKPKKVPENIKEMIEVVGELVDALVSNNIIKEAVRFSVKSKNKPKKKKKTVKAKAPFQEEILDKEIIPESEPSMQEAYTSQKRKDSLFRGKFGSKVQKAGPEEASGGALPRGPKGQSGPIPRGKQPLAQQAKQGQGRQINQTQMRQQAPRSEHQGLRSNTLKDEKMEMDPSAHQNYFRNKLNKRGIAKKEPQYFVTPAELYTSCVHCGTTEFVKTENGPAYDPCACFMITLLPDAKSEKPFVEVIKKSEDNYSLQFNPRADSDTVEAFLSTLKQKNKDDNY